MNTRFVGYIVFLAATAGTAWCAEAGDKAGHSQVELSYDIMDPSPKLAKRMQEKGDFETATMLNEAILKRDPSDRQALRRMIECHEAIEKKEKAPDTEKTGTQRPAPDDSLSELPNLIPDEPVVQANSQKASVR